MMHAAMSPLILAAALELSRIHGISYAAFFLLDRDIAFEVIAELLWNARPPCELHQIKAVATEMVGSS